MRKVLFLFSIIFLTGVGSLFAQVRTGDVVILKDGRQVRGQLEPLSPYGANVVKLKMEDGSVQTFSMDVVERIVPSQDLSGGKAPERLRPEVSTDATIPEQERMTFQEEEEEMLAQSTKELSRHESQSLCGVMMRSFFMPGWGQRYLGETQKGWIITGIYGGLVAGNAVAVGLAVSEWVKAVKDAGLYTSSDLFKDLLADGSTFQICTYVSMGLSAAALGLWLYAMIDGVIEVSERNSMLQEVQTYTFPNGTQLSVKPHINPFALNSLSHTLDTQVGCSLTFLF